METELHIIAQKAHDVYTVINKHFTSSLLLAVKTFFLFINC